MSAAGVKANPRYIILNIISFVLLSSAVLFLEHETIAGICTVLGFMLFIASARSAENGKQVLYTVLILWAAQSIRYSMVFGENLLYIIAVIVLIFIDSAVIGFAMALDNLFMRKYMPYIAVLFVPVIYTALTVALSIFRLGFITNITCYVMCIPAISQNLSLLGEFGMTFAVMLILSIVALAFTSDDKRTIIASGAVGLFLFAALFVYGDIQLNKVEQPSYSINVAVGISEQMDFLGNSYNNYTDEDRLELFKSEVEQAKEMGADILVLNEEFFEMSRNNEEEIMKSVCGIVRKNRIPVLFCADVIPKGDEYGENKAMYIDKNGDILFTYYKNNLVPFTENGYNSSTTGVPEYAVVNIGGHEINLSCVICFDVNNGIFMNRISDETELIIAPSWDWDKVNLEQMRTSLRSVELNTTVLKHTYEGFTYTSGPDGIHTVLDNRGIYEQVRMIEVPIWEK